jgi:hypothetical protein
VALVSLQRRLDHPDTMQLPAHEVRLRPLHHDHALDLTVATQTGAQLLGSMSTENIARGQDLPADRILAIDDGDVYEFEF